LASASQAVIYEKKLAVLEGDQISIEFPLFLAA